MISAVVSISGCTIGGGERSFEIPGVFKCGEKTGEVKLSAEDAAKVAKIFSVYDAELKDTLTPIVLMEACRKFLDGEPIVPR